MATATKTFNDSAKLAAAVEEVQRDDANDVGASAVPEVAPEDKLIRSMSAPSATMPVDNKDLLGSAPSGFENKPFEWVSASAPEYLPKKVLETDQAKFINPYMRNDIDAVTIRPGHRFTAPGRYHNMLDIEKYYDVSAGDILPEDTYVTSERNILPEYNRNALRGA